MPRFFMKDSRTLHIADTKNLIPEDVIKEGQLINEQEEAFAKLRRTMALFALGGPLSLYFSKEDFCIYTGNYDLDHSSNEDLIPVERSITYKS